jgi:hypothetical protein
MKLLEWLGFDSEETKANKRELARRIAQKEYDEHERRQERENRKLPCYQVGVNADGRVTLQLGYHSHSTLTMESDGVDQLIRILEAAKASTKK